jgi:hypothetical protein
MSKKLLLGLLGILTLLFVFSCNNSVEESTSTSGDSASAEVDTSGAPTENTDKVAGGRNPASVPEEIPVMKGTAMVYAPAKMIKDVPSIVNAVISKEELSAALAHFADAVQKQNPDITRENLEKNITSDTLDLYEHMGVKLEFDPSDFKQITDNGNTIQEFANKASLEWEWVLKPLRSTRKSILNFKFYYINPNNSQQHYILEKTISVVVSVDARSFLDKWGDFLLDDPKTTITAILIPFITFIGGFLSGKRKRTS